MTTGLVLVVVAIVLLIVAQGPAQAYLKAFAERYSTIPAPGMWLVKRDEDPAIERLRRRAVAMRGLAYLVFIVGMVMSCTNRP